MSVFTNSDRVAIDGWSGAGLAIGSVLQVFAGWIRCRFTSCFAVSGDLAGFFRRTDGVDRPSSQGPGAPRARTLIIQNDLPDDGKNCMTPFLLDGLLHDQ